MQKILLLVKYISSRSSVNIDQNHIDEIKYLLNNYNMVNWIFDLQGKHRYSSEQFYFFLFPHEDGEGNSHIMTLCDNNPMPIPAVNIRENKFNSFSYMNDIIHDHSGGIHINIPTKDGMKETLLSDLREYGNSSRQWEVQFRSPIPERMVFEMNAIGEIVTISGNPKLVNYCPLGNCAKKTSDS